MSLDHCDVVAEPRPFYQEPGSQFLCPHHGVRDAWQELCHCSAAEPGVEELLYQDHALHRLGAVGPLAGDRSYGGEESLGFVVAEGSYTCACCCSELADPHGCLPLTLMSGPTVQI